MGKLIFLNWRFSKILLNANSFLQFPSEGSSENLLLVSNYKILDDLIKHIESQINAKIEIEILILTHFNISSLNQPWHISKNDLNDKISSLINNVEIKISEFSGGEDFVYYGSKNLQGLFNENDEKLHPENFDMVWNYYWNELELENQKKKLIKAFLPLAIDIQGLSEIIRTDPVKVKLYYDEIRSEFINIEKRETEYFISLRDFSNLDKIEDKLESEYKKFKPLMMVNEIFNNPNLSNTFKENYLDPNNPSKFFPSWLTHVIEIIDNEIISSQNAKNSSNQ